MGRHNKLSLLLVLIAISAAHLPAQQKSPQKLDSFQMERAHQILRDAYENVKNHYYDRNFHGLDWNTRFKEYDSKIGNATSISQAFAIVAAFLDALKDSHTFFMPPARTFRLDYGYRLQLVGGKVFVTRIRPGTDAETKVHVGDEVIQCNGYDVNRDDFWTMEYYFDSLAPQKTMEMVLLDPAGQRRQATVDAKVQQLVKMMDLTRTADFNQLIRDQEERGHMVRQRYKETEDVMIWKMPLFSMSNSEVDHMFGIARKHKVLILDLRGNPGGSVQTLEEMAGNIFDHDIKIADRIGHKELKPQLAKTIGNNAFSGKLIVLVDSASASASELFARVVQLEKRGTVLGDRTSGKVMEALRYGNSQGMDVKIFYAFSVTDADLLMSDGKSLENTGVLPDELVLPTAVDLAAGKDPALARAAQLAGLKIDSAEAGKMFPFEWLPLGGS